MREAAYARALSFVQSQVDVAAAEKRQRLPTIAAMAHRAGVCYDTMRKAVGTFRSRGVLSVRHKRGVALRTPAPLPLPSQAVPSRRQNHERVREELLRWVRAGRFGPGESLPTRRELQQAFGCSYATVDKALRTLAEQEKLEGFGRGYRVPELRTSGSRNTVMLIVRGRDDPVERIGVWASRNEEQFQALDRQCTQSDVRLELALYSFRGGSLVRDDGARAFELPRQKLDTVLGFMVWAQGLEALRLDDFVAQLQRFRRPVAVLETTGSFYARRFARVGSLVRTWTMGLAETCGLHVGRYVLRRGHRWAAYVGRDPESRRIAGLRQAFGEEGHAEGVRVYVMEERPGPLAQPGRPELNSLLFEVRDALLERGGAHAAMGRMVHRHNARLGAMLSRVVLEEQFQSILERIARWRECTVWVAENDAVGSMCARYLRDHGLDRSIDLVAFDDTTEAFIGDFSSYNYNVPAVIRAMMEHLLHPVPLRASELADYPVELEGYVVERGTVQTGSRYV